MRASARNSTISKGADQSPARDLVGSTRSAAKRFRLPTDVLIRRLGYPRTWAPKNLDTQARGHPSTWTPKHVGTEGLGHRRTWAARERNAVAAGLFAPMTTSDKLIVQRLIKRRRFRPPPFPPPLAVEGREGEGENQGRC